MSIHVLEDGKCVIGAGGVWLPGCYEDERTARFAFSVPDEVKARLRDQAISRGDGVITWGDIVKAREELRTPNDKLDPPWRVQRIVRQKENNMSDKFWAVWRETGGAPPNKRHSSKEEAVTEAGRLTQQSNERYFVLEVIGVVTPAKFPVAYTEIAQ